MESTKETTTTAAAPAVSTPKTSTVTLRGAGGATLMLLAVRRADNSAVVTVTTREANKKPERGMTSTHPDMASAKVHLSKLARDAEKLGWKRGATAGFVPRPDAFSKLPAPPRASKDAK